MYQSEGAHKGVDFSEPTDKDDLCGDDNSERDPEFCMPPNRVHPVEIQRNHVVRARIFFRCRSVTLIVISIVAFRNRMRRTSRGRTRGTAIVELDREEIVPLGSFQDDGLAEDKHDQE